jgi:hypothetical protein
MLRTERYEGAGRDVDIVGYRSSKLRKADTFDGMPRVFLMFFDLNIRFSAFDVSRIVSCRPGDCFLGETGVFSRRPVLE